MDATSLSLLDRVRETSDAESWSRLVALYGPLLKRWALRYEIQESDADDVVQEVLAAVLSDLPKFQHNQRTGAFRSWLRIILANRVREFWRARKRRPVATGTSSIEDKLNQLHDDTSEASQIWNQEHDEYVLKRLMKGVQSRIEPKTWAAFKLQVIDGHAPEKVAQDLEISMSSVYTAKYRVLNALRRESDGLVDKM